MDENITPDGHDGGSDVKPQSPDGAVAVEALTLEELKATLGKEFPDKATALKSLKDTFSYVGKKKEEIAKEFGAEREVSSVKEELAQLRKDMWFKDNPDHAPYRQIIEKMGGNPSEVIATKEYATIFEKAKGFDEYQSKRTVLESNPRIAAANDTLAKAAEAVKSGKQGDAAALAATAVREAFKF